MAQNLRAYSFQKIFVKKNKQDTIFISNPPEDDR